MKTFAETTPLKPVDRQKLIRYLDLRIAQLESNFKTQLCENKSMTDTERVSITSAIDELRLLMLNLNSFD